MYIDNDKKQEVVSKVILKNTELDKYILEKYTSKKDLTRLLEEYAKGVFTPKILERVKLCGDSGFKHKTCS